MNAVYEKYKRKRDLEKKYKIANQSDVKENTQFLLIVFSKTSVHFEADERSKSAPGHGHPAHSETYDTNEIYAFDSEPDMKDFVSILMENDPKRSDFVIFKVSGKVRTTLSFNIE